MYKKEIFLEIDANLHQPIQSMEADSNSRAIRFYLTSNYAPLNLKDKKVIFKAVKPDSTDIVNDCEIIDVEKGIVETKVTKQLNAVPGRVNCQLSIIGANDYVLKTKKFGILVDSKLTESGIISSREYKTLENALSEVHEINKNFEQVNAKINEVATKGTTVEVIEEVTKEEIERQIADGTITHLMIEDGSVTPEKTSFYDEIATQKNLLKNAEFDYMGNNHNTVKKAIDSSIDWVLGEVNTAHHEGQHITATDTIEGHAKSAILKGNTLVNLLNKFTVNTEETEEWYTVAYTTGTVKSGKYILLYNVKETSETVRNTPKIRLADDTELYHGFDDFNTTTGIKKWIFTANTDLLGFNYWVNGNTGKVVVEDFILLKYQDGMENWDIPYFEGMKSVQMPVLTTTGKNLFDKTKALENTALMWKNGQLYTEIGSYLSDFIRVDKNTTYYLSGISTITPNSQVCGYDKDKNLIAWFASDGKETDSGDGLRTNILTVTNSYYIRFSIRNILNIPPNIDEVQLEKGTQATTYEPYKTNILTVNEPVELRGIGNVQDTLDLATGELTQRIGEVVLDGSDDELWGYNGNYDLFVCQGLTRQNDIYLSTNIIEKVMWSGANRFALKPSKYGFTNHKEGIEYLKNNPITIQYKIATESVKTVDLSDNHVYSYKDVTHYDCSSAEGSLVPTLSIDVPTNLPAVVTRQRVTIQELEKENVALKNEIEETVNSSVNGDLELMSSQFELDFRLFEIEMNLDMPMMAMMRGVKSMAMTVYQQAKTLILAGKYEREDMEYKLNRYKAAGRITVEEYDELIALMDARELVD